MAETAVVKHGIKNEKIGMVVSTSMQKTISVEVSRRVPHPLYKRIIGKRKKFYAHDEEGRAKVGDVVRIIECRPMSKLKRWRLGEVLRQAVQVAVEPEAVDLETTQPTAGSKSLRTKASAPRGKASAPPTKGRK